MKLNERAMLVNLSISQWGGRKKDKAVGREVANGAHAEQDAGAWWTHLVSRLTLRPIYLAEYAGRAWHREQTLPWTDAGFRILPAENFLAYTQQMRKIQADYQKVVNEFLELYPELVAAARKRLGTLFRPNAFPSVQSMRGKFSWTVELLPLPDVGDFRVDLGEETSQVKKEMEQQLSDSYRAAMTDLWERLYNAVSHVAERLSKPDNIFRDSMVGKLPELCDLLKRLNVADDKKLDGMLATVRKQIASCSPANLRDDEAVRKATLAKAHEVLEAMKPYIGEKGKS